MELDSMTDGKVTERKRKCSSCGTVLSPATIDISIPGLNRLVDKSYPKILKAIWLVIMVVSTAIGIYLTVRQLQKYFDYPIASKTYMERKEKVQFPPFSICAFYDSKSDSGYAKVLRDEIIKKCQQKNMQNCLTSYGDIKLRDLDIKLEDVWNRCHFDSVDVLIYNIQASGNPDDTPCCVKTDEHSPIGSCSVIRHTGQIPYFSALTRMELTIKSAAGTQILFLPHGESESTVSDFDTFNHELEFVATGTTTTLKILEEDFKLENKSGSECYEYYKERENLKRHALYMLSKIDSCRLPFLPATLHECQNYNDVNRSLTTTWGAILELWSEENLSGRRACRYKNYALSVDYVVPLEQKSNSVTETLLVIKFTADTIVYSEQYYSYDFAALVSDLFAFWGFFICLSAFVYVEIFEFLIRKIYHLCVHVYKSKWQI